MVSNIVYFHPYLGKVSNLSNIFQRGWNHQLDYIDDSIFEDFGRTSLLQSNPFFFSLHSTEGSLLSLHRWLGPLLDFAWSFCSSWPNKRGRWLKQHPCWSNTSCFTVLLMLHESVNQSSLVVYLTHYSQGVYTSTLRILGPSNGRVNEPV